MQAVTFRPSPTRLRLFVLGVAAVAFILFLSANGVAGFYTDWLWFDQQGQGTIWFTLVRTRVVLALIFTVAFFALFWGNLVLAERLRPEIRPATPEDDLVERYHQAVGHQGGRLRLAVSALFALVAGANTSTQWESWLLFRNAQTFGRTDPLFDRDAGFYVFQLPFIRFVVGWLFAALILTMVVVLIAHYLNGGIRAAAPGQKVSSGVKLQISVLLAVLALMRAVGYWLDRFVLVRSTRGDFDGALATDVIIQEPAYNLLALISLACGVVFIYNVRRPGWNLPLIAVGIWLISHFAVGSVFPMIYQRLRVVPDRSQREEPFVGYNIEATRFAYGLDSDSMVTYQLDYESTLTADDLENYDDVLSNVPVVDPALAVEEVFKSEGDRKIYSFSEPLDVDRYLIDGEERPVVLSARELNVAETGSKWESQHVIFTHGYGLAMAGAYDGGVSLGAGETRELNFLVSGLGQTEVYEGLESELTQPRIYYGDEFDGYAIVGAARAEADYQTQDNQSVPYNYDGDGGVSMGSLHRRLAFALRFRQIDPLVSGNVTNESKVIYNRDINERVRQLAPFLRFDEDPYPILSDGRLLWVMDGYTTSNSFPYAQSARPGGLEPGADLFSGYNYVRDSVKIVIDAYNGDVTMYVVDEDDPVLAAWREVFPDLFTDQAEMPDSVARHLRYPQDIFTVQTEMWSSYVVDDARDFIEGALAWGVANQPRPEAQGTESADVAAPSGQPMDPQYLMARLPDSDSTEFVLQRAFVPTSGSGGTSSRPELTALMMARSDPGRYGELVLFRLPAGQVNAPDRVHSEIRKNDDLTEFIKDKAGSQVEFGEMSIVLAGNTIVYIRPVYVEANSATAVPELQRIIAVSGDRIVMARTVETALLRVVSGRLDAGNTDSDVGSDANGGSSDLTGKSVVELIAEADQWLISADAVEDSDPDEAVRLRGQAQEALRAARLLLGGSVSDGGETAAGT